MRLGATVYIENSREAVPFYLEAFGLTLGYHEMHPDGTYLHAALMKGEDEIFCVSESRNEDFVKLMLSLPSEGPHPTMTYGLTLPDEDAVRHAFERLSRGGRVFLSVGRLPWSACCAEVVDKYGVFWYITA